MERRELSVSRKTVVNRKIMPDTEQDEVRHATFDGGQGFLVARHRVPRAAKNMGRGDARRRRADASAARQRHANRWSECLALSVVTESRCSYERQSIYAALSRERVRALLYPALL